MTWSKIRRIWKSPAGAFGLPLALVLMLTLATPVWAVPQMPYQIYGTVTVNGTIAPAGIQVTAAIGGVQYASTVTDAQGRYGYGASVFRVPADDPATSAREGGAAGDTVQLVVAGVNASTIGFTSGQTTNVNLTVTATINPAPVTTPPVITPPVTTPAPASTPAATSSPAQPSSAPQSPATQTAAPTAGTPAAKGAATTPSSTTGTQPAASQTPAGSATSNSSLWVYGAIGLAVLILLILIAVVIMRRRASYY